MDMYMELSPYFLSVKWGNHNALNAALFSEELLEYVLAKLGYNWSCENSAKNLPPGCTSKCFLPVYGEAVIEVMSCNIESITNSYKELVDMGVKDVSDYRRELCITATLHFWFGYSLESYLTFSALLAGISAFYTANGKPGMVEVSVQMLAYVLNFYLYHQPNGDWFGLSLYAQLVRQALHYKQIEFIPPNDLPPPS